MGDRKRRGLALGLESMEGRDLLSGLLVALHPTNVPYLTPSQVASIASASPPPGPLPGTAVRRPPPVGTNTSSMGGGLYNGGNNPQGITFPNTPLLGSRHPHGRRTGPREVPRPILRPALDPPAPVHRPVEDHLHEGSGRLDPEFLPPRRLLAWPIVIPAGFDPKNPAGTGGEPDDPRIRRPRDRLRLPRRQEQQLRRRGRPRPGGRPHLVRRPGPPDPADLHRRPQRLRRDLLRRLGRRHR